MTVDGFSPALAAATLSPLRSFCLRQVLREPIARKLGHLLERARFRKEVGSSGNDLKLLYAAEFAKSLTVQVNDHIIISAHDEQRGGLHAGEMLGGKVGATATRHNRCHLRECGS